MGAQRVATRTLVVLGMVVSLLVGLVAGVGAAGIIWAQCKLSCGEPGLTVPTLEPSSGPDGSSVPPHAAGDCVHTCNYLVLGSDSRSGLSNHDQNQFGTDAQNHGYRSDTMLLVQVDKDTKHSTIISFPRDLLVNVPGEAGLPGYGDLNLINSAFAVGATNGGTDGVKGGAELAAQTVQQLTGVQIDHEVVIDLEGFKAVVDAAGTVKFCTPVPLRDDPQAFGEPAGNQGSGLNMDHAGCYDLSGDDALALVRARYVIAGGVKDCISDYARIQRQQQFMRALMNKLLSPAMVTKVPGIVDAVTKKLTLDKELKVFDLLDLAEAMRGVASGNADFRVVPNQLDKQNIHLELTAEGETFLDRFRRGEPLGDLGTTLQYQPPGPAEIAVRVYDDTSQNHAQGDVYDTQLVPSGFKLMNPGAEPAGDLAGQGTVILYAPGALDKATVLSGFVPGVDVRKAKVGDLPDDTDVAVVVDDTYTYEDPGSGKVTQVTEKCPFT